MPEVLDDKFLCQYDCFKKFKYAGKKNVSTESDSIESNETPQDILDRAHQEITAALADDLLSEIMKNTPDFFEHLVVLLLRKMGYGGAVENSGMVVGQSGDEGIDGVIKEDKLGFNMIYIQAKRWDQDRSVGRPEIQKFVGALAGQGASKGLFITTAKFSQQAQDYVKKQHTTKVVLVDGLTLAKLMIDYDLGVSTVSVYPIKKLDTDFFEGML
ncbi:MAG: restriction endonuclease [Oscillospiraceae bacterium]